jgi:hypothetical protein
MAGQLKVDPQGMRQKVAHRGLLGILQELTSNAFDENITYCDVNVEMTSGRTYRVRVEDDSPDGFRNLEESYTLFAPSYKAGIPDKRGRFNLGEKVAVVLCKEARIESTTGTVIFSANDTTRSGKKREQGTLFEGELVSTAQEVQAALTALRTVIAPEHVRFTINGEVVEVRKPLVVFECTLPTVSEDDEGRLFPTKRKTAVSCYDVRDGEVAWLYEMGIPVVKPGDEQDNEPFHVNVHQKVPLNMDRDNVTPAYLKLLRREVLNHTAHLIPEDKINCTGVINGLAGAEPKVVNAVLDKLVGVNRFIQDPSDLEAENRLKGQGGVQMPGRMFPKDVWATIREVGAAKPAGVISPSPKPYSDDPNAPVVKRWPDEKVTEGMERYRAFVDLVAERTLGVRIADWRWVDSNNHFSMCCGPLTKTPDASISYHVNVPALGVAWFDRFPMSSPEIVDLTIHELGHHDGALHLTDQYYDNLTKIGAKLAVAVMEDFVTFHRFREGRAAEWL